MPAVHPHKFHEFYGDKRDPKPAPAPEPRPVRSFSFNLTCTRCRGTLRLITSGKHSALVECGRCHTQHVVECGITVVVDTTPAKRQLGNAYPALKPTPRRVRRQTVTPPAP